MISITLSHDEALDLLDVLQDVVVEGHVMTNSSAVYLRILKALEKSK